MFANVNIGNQFTTSILRTACAMSAVIGDAASKADRATYGSVSWLHDDRKLIRYTSQLRCHVGGQGEDAAQSLHNAWRSAFSQSRC